MPKTARLQVLIEPRRHERLKRLAKARGLPSVAELARIALDEYETSHGGLSRAERLQRVQAILRKGAAPVADPETMSRESMPRPRDRR